MTRIEIEAEILLLKKELSEYKWKKKIAESKLEEMEDILQKIRKKEREIEEGLHESIRTIERKLELVNPKSKFRTNYLKEAKSFLLSSRSYAALDETREAQARLKRKIFSQDDKIDYYKTKIRKLESRIDELKNQLS